MKVKILFLVFLFLIVGCDKDDDILSETDQTILFQSEYINYAWGYQHKGWIIDSSGNVRRFRMPEQWHFVDSLGLITSQDMNDNIQKTDSIILKIDKATLLNYFEKLKEVSNGKMSEPRQEMFDAGITQFSGYLYQTDSKKFKQVIIRQIGDVAYENKSAEANEIYNWMLQLNLQN
jgi:hypothetical protein